MPLVLGAEARDRVTGLRGILTGHTRHLTGCDSCAIQPPATKDAVPAAAWFEEPRIEVVGEGVRLEEPAKAAPPIGFQPSEKVRQEVQRWGL